MIIRFFCDKDNHELIFVKGQYNYMYGCPKYYKSYRKYKERPCLNNISYLEKQLVSKKINETYLNNELTIGSNLSIDSRIYTVMAIFEEEIFVSVKKEGIYYEDEQIISNQNVV